MNKENIYNKENEYKKEIFNLLSDDFKETTDDTVTLNLLKDLFVADIDDINNEDVLKNLLTENINSEVIAKNLETDSSKKTFENEVTIPPIKKVLFYDEDYTNIQFVAEKSVEDE
jgi:hypothetical protein